jgi:hypothetical protein
VGKRWGSLFPAGTNGAEPSVNFCGVLAEGEVGLIRMVNGASDKQGARLSYLQVFPPIFRTSADGVMTMLG